MKRVFSILFALALVLGFSLVAITPVAAASTWYVDPTGTDDGSHGTGTGTNAWKTIQYAVGHVGAGDTINAAAGTYTENIVINKRLTLQGAGRDATTIASAVADTDVIKLTTGGDSATARMVIKDLKVTNATRVSASYVSGINIMGGNGYITLDNVAVVDNAKEGVQIDVAAMADIEVQDCVLSRNGGCGLLVRYSGGACSVGGLKMINCNVDNNTEGLYMYRVTGLFIDGGTYNDNHGPVDTDGVGIYAGDPGVAGLNSGFATCKPNIIKNVTVTGNSRGMILNMYAGSDYTFENIVASGNNAPDPSEGEGITLGWRSATSNKITFNNVTASDNEKSNIWVIAYAGTVVNDLLIQNCDVSGSLLSGAGVGIYLYSASTGIVSNGVISGCEIANNNEGIRFRASTPLSAANTGNKAHFNSIVGNRMGLNNTDTDDVFDATCNWWGDSSGPGGGVNDPVTGTPANGIGNNVSANVAFDGWLGKPGSVLTKTNTGMASFNTSHGCIAQLVAVPTPPNPPVVLPHGMFSFNCSCIDPGDTVTLTITLPSNVPIGSKWWKYQNGSWYSLPIGSDNGDKIITVMLIDKTPTDPGLGDEDPTGGRIMDDGGVGAGGAVGWETYAVSKMRVLLPWIALLAAFILAASLLVLRRRRAQT
jgi:hypothetical protein